MKYKLNQKTLNFLRENIIPQFCDKVIKDFTDAWNNDDLITTTKSIPSYNTKCGVEMVITLKCSNFEPIHELKPYVWYPCEKFDGNPNKYWLIQTNTNQSPLFISRGDMITYLCSDAAKFMYIERP